MEELFLKVLNARYAEYYEEAMYEFDMTIHDIQDKYKKSFVAIPQDLLKKEFKNRSSLLKYNNLHVFAIENKWEEFDKAAKTMAIEEENFLYA